MTGEQGRSSRDERRDAVSRRSTCISSEAGRTSRLPGRCKFHSRQAEASAGSLWACSHRSGGDKSVDWRTHEKPSSRTRGLLRHTACTRRGKTPGGRRRASSSEGRRPALDRPISPGRLNGEESPAHGRASLRQHLHGGPRVSTLVLPHVDKAVSRPAEVACEMEAEAVEHAAAVPAPIRRLHAPVVGLPVAHLIRVKLVSG